MKRKPESAGEFAGLLAEGGRIDPQDVLYFRREVFRDGILSGQEAEAVFAMNSRIADKCWEWNDFFVEALTQYIVNRAEPRGYVTVANTLWLIDAISSNGQVEAGNEFELLVRILSKSQSSPEVLVGFTLNQIGRAVLESEGPLAGGRTLPKGLIAEAEVELIRAVLHAFGGERGISISKTEAEFLFDLNDALSPQASDPAWRELFVKAIANYLLASASYLAPARHEALAREDWLEPTKPDVVGTIARVLVGYANLFTSSFFDGIFDDAQIHVEKAWKIRNERQVQAEFEAEKLGAMEVEWLVERLYADGVIHENERALLNFLKRGSQDVDLKFLDLMEKESA